MQILNMTYQIIIVVNKKTKGRHASEVSVECGLGRGGKKHGWQQARTLKCKILLPKFNTWEQVHLERKKGSLPPFYNTIGRFLAKSLCRYGAIALPLHCNRNAIVP